MNGADTIAALATPRGRGALAVVRVSGERCFAIVGRCIARRKRFLKSSPRQLRVYRFSNPTDGSLIDQVTAVRYQAPRSATGEDMAEIICHGGEVVVTKVLEALLAAGARYAHRGEFSKRGFVNGKTTLVQAEAVCALVESASDAQHGSALHGVFGKQDEILRETREGLERALAGIEARIEFPEEDDIRAGEGDEALEVCRRIREFMEGELEKRERIRSLEEGIVVAIVGEPNVGKSTLFNRILRVERSLVHGESGTTRDFVSEGILVGGARVRLVDTAGIRETEEVVERMGAERSWGQAEGAHIVVWVTSAEEEMSETERRIVERCGKGAILGVVSKTDVADGRKKKSECEEAGVSALQACLVDQESSAAVVKALEKRIEALVERLPGESIIQNRRQEGAIEGAVRELRAVEDEVGLGDEVVAYRVRSALSRLGEFVGEAMPEDILNRIFGEFCIGK